MTQGESTVIDARGLVPPEPLELTLAALSSLAEDAEILLLLEREPFPLYGILERNGFAHRTTLRADGAYEIRIRRAAGT